MSSACMCHINGECEWCRQGNEIKRLREALKYIADHQKVGEGYEYADQYANSFIAKARQALKGGEPE